MSDDAMTKGLLDDLRARGYSTATGRATVALDGDIPRATFEAWNASKRQDLAHALGMEFHGSVPTWPMIAYRARAMREEKLAAEEGAKTLRESRDTYDRSTRYWVNGVIGARISDNETPTWDDIERRLRVLLEFERSYVAVVDQLGIVARYGGIPPMDAVLQNIRDLLKHTQTAGAVAHILGMAEGALIPNIQWFRDRLGARRLGGKTTLSSEIVKPRRIGAAMRILGDGIESKLDTVPGVPQKPKLTVLFDDQTEVP